MYTCLHIQLSDCTEYANPNAVNQRYHVSFWRIKLTLIAEYEMISNKNVLGLYASCGSSIIKTGTRWISIHLVCINFVHVCSVVHLEWHTTENSWAKHINRKYMTHHHHQPTKTEWAMVVNHHLQICNAIIYTLTIWSQFALQTGMGPVGIKLWCLSVYSTAQK